MTTTDSTNHTKPIDMAAVMEKWDSAREPIPPAVMKAMQDAGISMSRPTGDYRSAADIIAGDPLLKNLGAKEKETLKKQVGDYEHNADAAYRATQVLDHIERFDAKGTEISNRPPATGPGGSSMRVDSVSNNVIDGFAKSGEARPNTEAGRLQDFGKFGFESLKGKSKEPPPQPLALPLEDAVRPAGDNRTAQQIIDENPTLKNLGNQEGVKEGLKQRVGDYEHNADAAYRASQVIDYIQKVDEKGQPVVKKSGGNDSGDHKIDGFTKSGEAKHGTEAGRLKDFTKDGYESLKGIDGKGSGELVSKLTGDATKEAVKAAGGDASKLGKDYFTTGKTNANAADKTAAYVKLSETLAAYKGGQKEYQTKAEGNDGPYRGEGPSAGQQRDAFIKEVEAKLDKLAKDPDVKKFQQEKIPDALHARVEADPPLKAELQRRYDNATSTHALEDMFAKKDKDGKPVSTNDALAMFVSEPLFYGDALGLKPNLQEALKNAPKDIQDKVQAGYDSITSGADIKRLIDSGKTPDQAILESSKNKFAYDVVFGDKLAVPSTYKAGPDDQTQNVTVVEQGSHKFNDVLTKYARDDLLKGMSPDDLLKGLGVKDENDPALEKFVEQNLDKLFPDSNDRPKPQDVTTVLRGVVDAMRHGTAFDLALDDISKGKGGNVPPGMPASYNFGLMHAASGILVAGGLIARAETGNTGIQTQTAAQALGAAQLLTSGGSKFVAENMRRSNELYPKDKLPFTQETINKWKDRDNFGKSLGALSDVLSIVAGSINAKHAADQGDKVGAALQATWAGLSLPSAIATAGEVGFYVAGRAAGAAGNLVAQATAAVFEGIASAAGAVIGGVIAVGAIASTVVTEARAQAKEEQKIKDWYEGNKADFASFGITPPDYDTTRAKPNTSTMPPTEFGPIDGSGVGR